MKKSKPCKRPLSNFLFRGAILVCLLTFLFLTIANILLPGVERLICIRRILSFDTNQRLHYESRSLTKESEARTKTAKG